MVHTMNKVAMIYPYFGELPDIFYYWLKSVSYNKGIDVYIYTDCSINCEIPSNVYVSYITFADFKREVSKHFDFEISLEHPYKICDFRPAFGEIFTDVLAPYQYWGYGDVDVIWGNIFTFIKDDIKSRCERISQYGHFSLYLNDDKMRQLYKDPTGLAEYKKVFTDSKNYTFDEFWTEYGIEHIAKRNGIVEKRDLKLAGVERIYRKREMCFRLALSGEQLPEDEQNVFWWKDGRLYMIRLRNNQLISKEEYAYVHFQKRKIRFPMRECWVENPAKEFWVAPNRAFLGGMEEVIDYLTSSEYKNCEAEEQRKFTEFRAKYPDIY